MPSERFSASFKSHFFKKPLRNESEHSQGHFSFSLNLSTAK